MGSLLVEMNMTDKIIYRTYPDEPDCPTWTLRQIIEDWLRSRVAMDPWKAEEKAEEIIKEIEGGTHERI
jgi:hypothetical protein